MQTEAYIIKLSAKDTYITVMREARQGLKKENEKRNGQQDYRLQSELSNGLEELHIL